MALSALAMQLAIVANSDFCFIAKLSGFGLLVEVEGHLHSHYFEELASYQAIIFLLQPYDLQELEVAWLVLLVDLFGFRYHACLVLFSRLV